MLAPHRYDRRWLHRSIPSRATTTKYLFLQDNLFPYTDGIAPTFPRVAGMCPKETGLCQALRGLTVPKISLCLCGRETVSQNWCRRVTETGSHVARDWFDNAQFDA